MQSFAQLVLCVLLAVSMAVAALVSIQNVEPVAIRFLTFQSIEIPFGLLLTMCVGSGSIATSFFLLRRI